MIAAKPKIARSAAQEDHMMRRSIYAAIGASLSIGVLISSVQSTAASRKPSTPARVANKRDFGGLWVPVGSALDVENGVTYTGADMPPSTQAPPLGTMPKLKGKYLEDYKRRVAAVARTGGDIRVTCKPLGMPGVMGGPYAVEILQTPTQINFEQEFLQETRRIYLDGRLHPNPAEQPPTNEGHSTGRWEGSTLVVETVNVRPSTVLGDLDHSDANLGHSNKVRFVERWHLTSNGRLQVDTRVEDPEALVEPWHYAVSFRRANKGDEFQEYNCDDNDADKLDPATGKEVLTIPAEKYKH